MANGLFAYLQRMSEMFHNLDSKNGIDNGGGTGEVIVFAIEVFPSPPLPLRVHFGFPILPRSSYFRCEPSHACLRI